MIYLFGDYELDTTLYELRAAGVPCKLEPRVFNVLAYLIQHRAQVVTREELLDHAVARLDDQRDAPEQLHHGSPQSRRG